MNAKQPVHVAYSQQRQMRIGAESPVSQHQVAGLQLAGDRRALGHLVGPERGRRGTEQHAGGEIEQSEPLRHGEATALALATGLAEVALQFGYVGHGEARAIDQPDPMTEPTRSVGGSGSERGGGLLEEPLEDGQRETLAGLAVGTDAERPTAEMDHMLTGRIPVEDLKQEEVDRGGGVEESVPPAVTVLATSLLNGVFR